MSREQRNAALCVLMASVLFSIGGLCVKLIPWSPIAINGARNLIGATVIGLFLLITHHPLRFNKPILIGALSVMGVTTLFTIANKLTTAANTIVLQFTAPVFVILLMLLFFGVRPTRLDLIASALVLLGVALFFVDGLQAGNWLGNLVAVLSGVCYAGVFMLNAAKGADPLSSTFIGQLACGVLLTPFCFLETDFSAVPLAVLAVMGIFQVGLAYVFLSVGIGRTPPVMACLIAGVEPILTPLWTLILFQEPVTPLSLCGAVIVVGAILAYQVIKGRRDGANKTTA